MKEIIKHTLDKVDRTILQELEKNCRIPSTTLAKKVRKSRQTVEYRIQNLVDKGIITGFNASFNPHKMGYRLFKIYLKLRNIPSEKTRLFEFLQTSGKVYWMGECSGSWDLIFAVFAKNEYDFFEVKNELISEFTDLIVKEEGQILLDVIQWPKMFLTGKIEPWTMFGGKVVDMKLDEVDYAILEEIVNNGRISIVELANKIKSTVPIVQNKIKKLQENGIIIQFRLSIDLKKLGLEHYKAIITVDRYNKQDEKRFLAYLSNIPEVHYFIRNLWTFEPEIVVNNYQEYYKIIEDLKKEFPEVIRTVDSVLMITDEWTPGFKNLFRVD